MFSLIVTILKRLIYVGFDLSHFASIQMRTQLTRSRSPKISGMKMRYLKGPMQRMNMTQGHRPSMYIIQW